MMEILYQNLANIELPHVIMWIIGGLLIYLAIAKEIVEQHGGTITAVSENQITAFTVKLPY